MSKTIESIDEELADWLHRQPVFFVASAPLSQEGHVNCSPKGGDCFRVLGPHQVAYQDLTGSGAETVAHLRENGRIVLMFCAFDGKPQVVRLHGHGTVLTPDAPEYRGLAARFPSNAGTRSIITVEVSRVSTSCGYAVPRMEFRAHRDGLDKWAVAKGPEGLEKYRAERNRESIDGLPAFVE